MAIVLDESYFKPLDDFFAKNTVTNVNRDSYLVCNLFDKPNNIHVSLVFMRDWDSLETDSFNQVIIQGKGAVFTFPCYWISIPKELAYTYIKYVVQAFYDEYVAEWIKNTSGSINNSGNTSSGNGTTNGSNCPPCNCGIPYQLL